MMKKIKSLLTELQELIKGNSTRGKLFKGGIGSLAINVGNRVLVLISGVLLVRILGKAEYGVYSYILSLVFVFIIPVEYGLSNLIVRETAQGIAKEDKASIVGIWQWSVKITVALCAILILASAAGILWAGGQFSRFELVTFIWALSLIPFQSMIMLSSAALRGLKYVILGQLADLIILPGIFVVLFLGFHVISPGINAARAMALRAFSTVIAFIFSIIFILRKTPKEFRKTTPTFRNRFWVASALPLGLSSGLGMVKTRITILLMAFFVSAPQIGTFQVAVSTSSIAGLVLQATNATLAPQFASLYVQNKKQTLQKLVTINTRIVLGFNLLATILFIFFGKSLLSLVFGPDLVDAYPAVLIMLIGQLGNSIVGPVAYLLNMTGNEKDVMKVIGMSSLANVILTLAMTPFLGLIGGAISTAFSLLLAQIAMAIIVYRRINIITHPFVRITSGR